MDEIPDSEGSPRRSAAPSPVLGYRPGIGLNATSAQGLSDPMKLNHVEKALMNNPIRAAIQRRFEAPLLERLGGRMDGQLVLEVGCGRGVGTQLLLDRFGAREVHAFDLDPGMITQAQRRLDTYPTDRLELYVADATTIPEPDERFDAAIDFGILHHVPDWPAAVAEVARVLKPGGRFYFEEVTRQALDRWIYRTFLDHPANNRFTAEQFVSTLERHGIQLLGQVETFVFGDFVAGVGHKEG